MDYALKNGHQQIVRLLERPEDQEDAVLLLMGQL